MPEQKPDVTDSMSADASHDDQSQADMAPDGRRREPVHPDDVDAGLGGDPDSRQETIHPDDVETSNGRSASSDMDQGVADRMNGGMP